MTIFQSVSGRLRKGGRKRRERIDESQKVQTTPTRIYCKRSRPLLYCNQNCWTPRRLSSGWLVWGLTALSDSISVSIGPSPKERERERGKKGQMRVKMSKQPPPAPTASALGPCPTVIQIVERPGTGSLLSTIAQPDHPLIVQ